MDWLVSSDQTPPSSSPANTPFGSGELEAGMSVGRGARNQKGLNDNMTQQKGLRIATWLHGLIIGRSLTGTRD